jgi:hypothetical protein
MQDDKSPGKMTLVRVNKEREHVLQMMLAGKWNPTKGWEKRRTKGQRGAFGKQGEAK